MFDIDKIIPDKPIKPLTTVKSTPSELKKLIGWSFVILTYLFVEWIYNQHLLVVLSYAEINFTYFTVTEVFGKCIASIGLNLVLKKIFKYSGIKRFLIGFVVGYFVLTALFDYAVEAFPDGFRHFSYYSMLHRKDVVNYEDVGKIMAFSENESWYVKPLILSYFVFTANDGGWNKVEADTRSPIDEKIAKLNKDREKLWGKYQKAQKARKKLDDYWIKYQKYNQQYERYKYGKYEKRARKKFITTTGLQPDLHFDYFIRDSNKEYYKFMTEPVFEGIEEVDVLPIYGKEIPEDMSKESFMSYIDNNIQNVETKAAPALSQVRANKKASDAVAVLVIPPISIGLSLLSIILNVVFLVHSWISYFMSGKTTMENRKAVVGYYVSVCVFLFGIYVFKDSAIKKDDYWVKAENTYATQYKKLSYFWDFTLKFESFLCITNEPPLFIQKWTDAVYLKNDILRNRYGTPYMK